ncbi:hypothetical protein A3768_4627 (plasmid) [Ralstonia solanacearum]|nr:hypothetical protein A3768_4627 [Ralstonia solanacearum]
MALVAVATTIASSIAINVAIEVNINTHFWVRSNSDAFMIQLVFQESR